MTVEFKQKRQYAADWLFKQFPNAFEGLKPLKVGIFNDIRDFECEGKPSGVWIRRALYMHTSRMTYRKHLIAGVNRVDLFGEPSGEVTTEEEEKAKEDIAEQRQYNRDAAKRKRASLSKLKKNNKLPKGKDAKAKPEVIATKEVGEIGRQILTLKKNVIKSNSEPSGISNTESILKNYSKPVLTVKKKRSIKESVTSANKN